MRNGLLSFIALIWHKQICKKSSFRLGRVRNHSPVSSFSFNICKNNVLDPKSLLILLPNWALIVIFHHKLLRSFLRSVCTKFPVRHYERLMLCDSCYHEVYSFHLSWSWFWIHLRLVFLVKWSLLHSKLCCMKHSILVEMGKSFRIVQQPEMSACHVTNCSGCDWTFPKLHPLTFERIPVFLQNKKVKPFLSSFFFPYFFWFLQDSQEKNTNPVKAEEAKLKAKYPGLGQRPGGSDFLMKRLQKGVSYHGLAVMWSDTAAVAEEKQDCAFLEAGHQFDLHIQSEETPAHHIKLWKYRWRLVWTNCLLNTEQLKGPIVNISAICNEYIWNINDKGYAHL